MTNEFTTAYEPIDLCACFDMIFDPPAEVVREWEKEWNERFMANKERGYYGRKHFCCDSPFRTVQDIFYFRRKLI